MNLNKLRAITEQAHREHTEAIDKARTGLQKKVEPLVESAFQNALVLCEKAAADRKRYVVVHKETDFNAYVSRGNDFLHWKTTNANGLFCSLLMGRLRKEGLEPKVEFGYDGGGVSSWYSIVIRW